MYAKNGLYRFVLDKTCMQLIYCIFKYNIGIMYLYNLCFLYFKS